MSDAKPMPQLNKNYRVKLFGLIASIVILLFGVSCSSSGVDPTHSIEEARQLAAEPATEPSYLSSLQPSPGYIGPFKSPLCFTVLSEGIWEPGDLADPLIQHLLSHIQFIIDDQKITSKPVGKSVLQMLSNKYDEQGNFLGSYGGSIQTCYDLKLDKGLHIANVEVSSMSGKQHSYKWAFEIK